MGDDPLLTSLLTALAAAPDDVALRVHVADLLARAGRNDESLQHCARAMAAAPGNIAALALMQRLLSSSPRTTGVPSTGAVDRAFDWQSAEDQVADIPAPAFLNDAPGGGTGHDAGTCFQIQRPAIRLTDVGGMQTVKQRLERAFLGPMRNPTMARQFGKSLSGGLLLYGPPGCGKTFLARAMAGELGARFLEIGISDVLDMWVGTSERNLVELFDVARRSAPCVLFLDEIDALAQKRSHLTHSGAMRTTVNQLLAEMDSANGRNDGVFVLGATNHPWDLDSAFRRPGRFDRMVLVLPPDLAARAVILRYHLRERPVGELDLDRVARATEHYSGADLAHLCDTAAERALAESMRTNRLHPLTTTDLLAVTSEVTPSTGPWFALARNVALFANGDGSFDELAGYLRAHRNL